MKILAPSFTPSFIGLSLAFSLFALSAEADVSVERHILQKGYFTKASCTPDPTDASYNSCGCEADIRYPIISGMKDSAVQQSLNDTLKARAEKEKCVGAEAKKEKGKEASSVKHSYEITFRSPSILAFRFTDWAYSGGAHGDGAVEGVIVDLAKGRILSIADLLADKDLPSVNKAIYDVLAAKPEEEVFRDQIESRKDKFLEGRQCKGCTLTLSPAGLQVVFQTYEVAPYAVGNTQITIPPKYIQDTTVTQALAEEKKSPEKKK